MSRQLSRPLPSPGKMSFYFLSYIFFKVPYHIAKTSISWFFKKITGKKPKESHYLKGIFKPVSDQVNFDNLKVIKGEIPSEISGVYIRNGPNPQFVDHESYHYVSPRNDSFRGNYY